MEIFTVKPKNKYGSNCYVIKNNNSCAIIDPSASFDEIKAVIPDFSDLPKYVLITHAHFDHILEVDNYAELGVEICVGKGDAEALSDPFYNCYEIFLQQQTGYNGKYTALSEGDTIDLDGLKISILETPGHTRGSVCYLLDEVAFVGDLIFEGGGYGRFDFPGGERNSLFNSIKKFYKVFTRGKVFSGHGSPFLI